MRKPMQNHVTPDSECTMNKEAVEKISYELREPLFNIHGSSEELQTAITTITELVKQHQEGLPEDFCDKLSQLITEDMHPCLNFLLSHTSQLNLRIDNISETFANITNS